jgi:sialate O-acetylesterase
MVGGRALELGWGKNIAKKHCFGYKCAIIRLWWAFFVEIVVRIVVSYCRWSSKLFYGAVFMKTTKSLTISMFLLVMVSLSFGDVKLPSVISSNMVLQQKSKVAIWGWADPGEKVSITASWKRNVKVTAGKDGKWSAKMQTPNAGGPYTVTVKGNNTITLENVLVGEVWVCSGQSNMQFAVTGSDTGEKYIAEADYPNIRLFGVKRNVAGEPQEDCVGNWAKCSPETVARFSAVGYYFGLELYKELDVPIGLISSNWGGTPAEAWTRKEYLENDDMFAPILERHERKVKNLPNAKKMYPKKLERWQQQVKEAEANGKKRKPKKPEAPTARNHRDPSSLYNGMIAPLVPYGIKGVIWYQGEANVARAWQYRKLFPAMITNWRKDWKQGNFPFYFVQIAPFKYSEERPSQELREAQFMTLSLANTGIAVTMDVGNRDNIHPKNKLDVGKRLALWALAKDYGKRLVYSGPLYKSKKIEGDKIRLSFDHVGSGLMAKGGELTDFTIAGSGKEFVDAKAVIDGKTIVVSSESIKKPVSVRFGWTNAPEANLFNKEGLPASSFRTDDWPGKTYGLK